MRVPKWIFSRNHGITEEPARPIRQNSLTTPKRLSYVPGVEAWVKAVTPIPRR